MRVASSKIFDSTQHELSQWLQTIPRPLVFTNGCFDILHRGHVTYLEQARMLGAALIVAVNTDDSVRRQNKAPDRPINTLADRMALLAALEAVDGVIAFDEDTPLNLIKQILPQHLVKGGDWQIQQIVGANDVLNAGGEVHSIEFAYQRSTTNLIAKIRGV